MTNPRTPNNRQQKLAAAKAIQAQIVVELNEFRLRLLLVQDLKTLAKKSKELLAMTPKEVIDIFRNVLLSNRQGLFQKAMFHAPIISIQMKAENIMEVTLKIQRMASRFDPSRFPPGSLTMVVQFADRAMEKREVAALSAAEKSLTKSLVRLESLTWDNIAELVNAYEAARQHFDKVAVTPSLRYLLSTPGVIPEVRGLANQFSDSMLRGPFGVGRQPIFGHPMF